MLLNPLDSDDDTDRELYNENTYAKLTGVVDIFPCISCRRHKRHAVFIGQIVTYSKQCQTQDLASRH